jgi:hypothetical protein
MAFGLVLAGVKFAVTLPVDIADLLYGSCLLVTLALTLADLLGIWASGMLRPNRRPSILSWASSIPLMGMRSSCYSDCQSQTDMPRPSLGAGLSVLEKCRMFSRPLVVQESGELSFRTLRRDKPPDHSVNDSRTGLIWSRKIKYLGSIFGYGHPPSRRHVRHKIKLETVSASTKISGPGATLVPPAFVR